MLTQMTQTSALGTSTFFWLTRPEVPLTFTRTGGVSHGQVIVNMYGNFRSAVVTKNQIAINTDRYAYMYDCRYHTAPNVMQVMEYARIFAVTDDYLVMEDPQADVVRLYKRDSVSTYSYVCNVNRYCNHAALSLTKVCCQWDGTNIYDIGSGTSYYLKNYAAEESEIIGVFFIYGDLYIVREQ